MEREGTEKESWLVEKFTKFCSFLGMPIEGFEEDILQLLRRMKERKERKEISLG